ncbi:MAG: hypothetical protein Q8Q54_13495 [Methylococcales bacterium]|nr:hypothetical protein [Methylococcales bacterium]MDP3839927.1 hypothetical protein [Methylococcales bacterium]
MRPIKFDLPLNGTRIATLEQLEGNLTPEILEPFRSGKLAKWLRVRKLDEQAEAVEALLAGDNEREMQLLKSLYGLFGGETDNDLLQVAIAERKRSLPSSQESYDMELEAVKTAFEKEIELIKSKYEIEQTKNSIKNNIDIEKISEIIGTTLFTLNDMGNI